MTSEGIEFDPIACPRCFGSVQSVLPVGHGSDLGMFPLAQIFRKRSWSAKEIVERFSIDGVFDLMCCCEQGSHLGRPEDDARQGCGAVILALPLAVAGPA